MNYIPVQVVPVQTVAVPAPIPQPTAAQVRVRCDGDTVSAIIYRVRPPSAQGVINESYEATIEAAGFPHVTSRPSVLRDYLQIKVGQLCTELARRESERLLRAQPFLASAVITVVREAPKRVRLVVFATDELPFIVGAAVSNGSLSSLTLGSLNVAGLGLSIAVSGERGFAYRNGYGIRATQYGMFGRPDYLAVDAHIQPLGEALSVEFAEPFLTELQRDGYLASVIERSDAFAVTRPTGDPVAQFGRRTAYILGWVHRIGAPNPNAGVGLLGFAIVGEDSRVESRVVVRSDTGLVDQPGVLIGTGYPKVASTRPALLGGFRKVRFESVTGFDALRATQDLGIGLQVSVLAGTSLNTSSRGRDVLLSTDLYAGNGDERRFLEVRALAEGYANQGSNRWSGLVASARAAWYGRPSDDRLRRASIEWSALHDVSVPMQLSFRDPEGGIAGFGGSRYSGGARAVARYEERWMLHSPSARADLAVAAFGEAGRLWAGDAPFGESTGMHAALGVSLMSAIPAGGKRIFRVDFAVPLNPPPGGGKFEVRFRSTDRTRLLWTEPGDVARARSGTVPVNLMKW